MFNSCFIGQWVKRSKHGLFVFPPKKTLMWRRHCWHCWPIVLQYYVKAKYRLISGMKFFHTSVGLTNQKPHARVCVRSINQSNRSISVWFSFLFCSRVFISRSYENLSIRKKFRPLCPEPMLAHPLIVSPYPSWRARVWPSRRDIIEWPT